MKTALCVGINSYGGGSDLSGCVNDAQDWGEALAVRGFHVRWLLDSAATSDAIMANLRDMIGKLEYGDLFVLQFSGHGSWINDQSGDEPDGRDEILCSYDIMSGKWVSDDDLHEVFSQRARGARIVFLSDCCHSGTANRFAALSESSGHVAIGGTLYALPTRRVRFMPPGTFMRALQDRSAIEEAPRSPTSKLVANASVLISGCRDTEYSYDAWFNGRPNGAFTRAAIDSLAENPLSYADWYRFIRKRLPTSEHPQTPMLSAAAYQRRWGVLEEGR